MTQALVDHEQDSSFDVFSLEKDVPQAPTEAIAKDIQKDRKLPAGWMNSPALQKGALAVVGVIGCVWAFWPADAPRASARSLTPVPHVASPVATKPVVAEPAPAEMEPPKDLIGAQRLEEATKANASSLAELAARVQLLESKEVSARTTALERGSAGTPPKSSPVAKPVQILTGYSLNTVFPGQAWIEREGATSLVQVGDVIDGIRVIRIDPVNRTVLTAQGVIK